MEKVLSRTKKCLYCKHDLEPAFWNSEWGELDMHHYKSIQCHECGKKNWVQLKFEGSGHDEFLSNGDKGLESKLKKFWMQ